MTVRPLQYRGAVDLRQAAAAEPDVRDFLRQRDSAVVARRGEMVDALARPAVVATDAGGVAGVLTGNYGIPIRDEIELAQDLPLRPRWMPAA
jgi:hypothetical protein